MGKNVAVFVDVANIFYAAKAAGVDIDYVTLLKAATAGRDFVRAYAYTGLDPENENQRNFHSFLARHGYKVVSKDIRKYGDGKVKANLDIELVVDMMKTARNLDVAVVISGDGDFAPAIRAVQEMGVRVEVISFRGNTSSDLIEVADLFTDIAAIAKVEKGSSRSGRRVADAEEEDLSMTEVPDKLTEGTGRGRGRSRGRTRTERAAPERVALEAAPARPTRRRTSPAAPMAARGSAAGEPAVEPSAAGLVALPGEKLSRVPAASAAAAAGPAIEDEETTPFDADMTIDGQPGAAEAGEEAGAEGEAGRRRRRRRGGRGRGRGRGTGSAETANGPEGGEVPAFVEDDLDVAPAPRIPRAAAFGSVWDAQIGTPTAPAPLAEAGSTDEEDFEEPEIPEYLIAERNRDRGARAGGQGGRGPRGGRSAYVAAMERERYGGAGRGGSSGRYQEPPGRAAAPAPRSRGADRSADRRPERSPGRGGDPWSEVPPEVEAMLRQQLVTPSGGTRAAPTPAAATSAPKPARRRPTGKASEAPADEPAADVAEARTAEAAPAEATTAPKRRTRKPAAAPGAAPAASPEADASEPKPARRRTTRKAAEAPADAPAPVAAEVGEAAPAEATTAPKRRTRKTAAAPES